VVCKLGIRCDGRGNWKNKFELVRFDFFAEKNWLKKTTQIISNGSFVNPVI
jgi:hypothetical protein